ncbi:MAG: FeoB-associated Cys-rich membrane protein [Peptococcaceae bacterium]|nr:FeoB-associated Cys-rich membrane protein [Peptococcaceae bacterium]
MLATTIISLLLVCAVGLAIRSLYRSKKQGATCGCGCSGCGESDPADCCAEPKHTP